MRLEISECSLTFLKVMNVHSGHFLTPRFLCKGMSFSPVLFCRIEIDLSEAVMKQCEILGLRVDRKKL